MISRANGLCLDFNTMMVLMLVCRHMLTILRKLGFATYLPIDNNIWLHKGMMFNRLNLVMFVKNYQTAFKVGGLKKKSADQPRPYSNQLAQIRERLGSNHSQSLMAENFEALWPTDPKFLALKDLILFKRYIKNQDARSTLRVDFSLSKWPHFHRAYLVTDCKQKLVAADGVLSVGAGICPMSSCRP